MPYELVSADEAGIDPARLDVFLRRARLEVEDGPLPSAQVAVARGGRLVAFEYCSSPSVTTLLPVSSIQSRPVMPMSNRPSAT